MLTPEEASLLTQTGMNEIEARIMQKEHGFVELSGFLAKVCRLHNQAKLQMLEERTEKAFCWNGRNDNFLKKQIDFLGELEVIIAKLEK
jgi:hypothetical protein